MHLPPVKQPVRALTKFRPDSISGLASYNARVFLVQAPAC